MLKNGKWSNKYSYCVKCRTVKLRHRSKGLCVGCYCKKTYLENKEYHQLRAKSYRANHKEALIKHSHDYYQNNRIQNKELKKTTCKYCGKEIFKKILDRRGSACQDCLLRNCYVNSRKKKQSEVVKFTKNLIDLKLNKFKERSIY